MEYMGLMTFSCFDERGWVESQEAPLDNVNGAYQGLFSNASSEPRMLQECPSRSFALAGHTPSRPIHRSSPTLLATFISFGQFSWGFTRIQSLWSRRTAIGLTVTTIRLLVRCNPVRLYISFPSSTTDSTCQLL